MKKLMLFIVPLVVFGCSSVKTASVKDKSVADTDWSTMTYTAHVQPLISLNCTGCHGDSNPAAGISLTSYSKVKEASANGLLLNRINDAMHPMPTSGLMPAKDRLAIVHWSKNNYPE